MSTAEAFAAPGAAVAARADRNAGEEPTVHLAINTPLPDPSLPFAETA